MCVCMHVLFHRSFFFRVAKYCIFIFLNNIQLRRVYAIIIIFNIIFYDYYYYYYNSIRFRIICVFLSLSLAHSRLSGK